MGKCFYIFIFLCGVQLHASDTLVISKDLGKPPLARPKERAALQMKKNRAMLQGADQSTYYQYLNDLSNKINDTKAEEKFPWRLEELDEYQKAVDREIEEIQHVIQFNVEQEIQDLWEHTFKGLSQEQLKRNVKKCLDMTTTSLLNDKLPSDEVYALQFFLKKLNEKLKTLK